MANLIDEIFGATGSWRRFWTTDATRRHWEPIGSLAVAALYWLFNGPGDTDGNPITGGIQALATLVVGLVTVALALVLYGRTESEPSRMIVFLYIALSAPLLLAMIVMIRSKHRNGFALDHTARMVARSQVLLWLFVIGAVSIAYGSGAFSTPGVLMATNVESKPYTFKLANEKYGISVGDHGALIYATLNTDGHFDLPDPIVIDLELADKYRKAWKIVSVSDPDNRPSAPSLLPWGPQYHKKLMWEEIRPNSTYRIAVTLHRLDQPGQESNVIIPGTGLRIKAYLRQ